MEDEIKPHDSTEGAPAITLVFIFIALIGSPLLIGAAAWWVGRRQRNQIIKEDKEKQELDTFRVTIRGSQN